MAATKYRTTSGGTGNWSDDTGTWSSTAYPSYTTTTHPISTSNVVIDSHSGAVALDGANEVNDLTCTTQVANLVFTAGDSLKVFGAITTPASNLWTGTGTLNLAPPTSKVWTLAIGFTAFGGALTFSGAGTILTSISLGVGSISIAGLTSWTAGTSVNNAVGTTTFTTNGGITLSANTGGGNTTFKVPGGINLTSGGYAFNLNLEFIGTGNDALVGNDWTSNGLVTYTGNNILTGAFNFICNGGLTVNNNIYSTVPHIIGGTAGILSGSGVMGINIIFNCTSATISGVINYGYKTITYTAGTITTTGSTLSIVYNCLINVPPASAGGFDWYNMTVGGNENITMLASMKVSNLFNVFGASTVYFINSGGAWTYTTKDMNLNSSTLSMPNDINISGTLTISSANTQVNSGGSWAYLTGNIVMNDGSSLVMAHDLVTGGSLTVNGTATLSGAYNIQCATFNYASFASSTFTIPAGKTLTIATNSYIVGNPNPSILNKFVSGTPGSYAYIVYGGILVNCVSFGMYYTDINNGGSTVPIYNYAGKTLSHTVNIINVTANNFLPAGIFIS